MKSWRDVLPIHPAAELFPRMTPEELRALGEDITANGLMSPIVLWQPDLNSPAKLLDGRNRLDAVALVRRQPVRIEPLGGVKRWRIVLRDSREIGGADRVIVLDKSVDPYAYVISANIHRRHLTAEQKRELIAKLIKATPEKSDRQIAETVKASHHTVGAVRSKMESRGQVAHVEKRTDSKGRKQTAKRRIAPHRQALAEQMQRGFQLAKVERYVRGNVSAEEKRDERSKMITAGHHVRAKEEHPDAGGSHEKMVAVNQAREDLEAGNKIINVGEWWNQEANVVAAQMAKHFTIKKISELCAMAIDMRKAAQAQAPERADDPHAKPAAPHPLDIPGFLDRTKQGAAR
jgi:hypothetical protein